MECIALGGGGAQLLRQLNVADNIIMEQGRWSSAAYLEYLKLNDANAKNVAKKLLSMKL